MGNFLGATGPELVTYGLQFKVCQEDRIAVALQKCCSFSGGLSSIFEDCRITIIIWVDHKTSDNAIQYLHAMSLHQTISCCTYLGKVTNQQWFTLTRKFDHVACRTDLALGISRKDRLSCVGHGAYSNIKFVSPRAVEGDMGEASCSMGGSFPVTFRQTAR